MSNVYKSWTIYKIVQDHVKVCKVLYDNLFVFSLQGTHSSVYGGAVNSS